jgi:hypothetical protein
MSIFPKLLKFTIELMFIKVNFQNKVQKQNQKIEFNSIKSCNNNTCNCKEKFKESKLLQFNNEMTSHEQKNFILNSVIQSLSQTKSQNSYKFECFLKLNKVCTKFF